MSTIHYDLEELANLAAVISTSLYYSPNQGCELMADYSKANTDAAKKDGWNDAEASTQKEIFAEACTISRSDPVAAAVTARGMRYNLNGSATIEALDAIVVALGLPVIAREIAKN